MNFPSRWLRRIAWRARPPVLALGGGGARGFAHIGFLEILEREGMRLAGITGTSAGAVIGGMFLALGSSDAVIDRWREAFDRGLIPEVSAFGKEDQDRAAEHPLLQVARRIRDRVVISLAVNKSTLIDGDELDEALDFLLPDVDIVDLRLPFVAVAADLRTGEEVRLARGPLRRAVRASSSIPGMVPPIEIEGRLLTDAGIVAEVPVGAAGELGRPVIAVDVSSPIPPYREGRLVLETLARTAMMTSTVLRQCQLREANRVVHPEIGQVVWSDWNRFDELVEAGRDAARRLLD